MQSIQLVDRRPEEIIASYRGVDVTSAQFVQTVKQVAKTLPERCELINLCANRFHFFVYFCAAISVKGYSVLPPNKQSKTIDSLLVENDRRLVVIDNSQNGVIEDNRLIEVPHLTIPDEDACISGIEIDPSAVAAYVYTSGSTGKPKCLIKKVSTLLATARMLATRINSDSLHFRLIATVPPQHMYGLETSVAMPLVCSVSVDDETPFYPADVMNVIQRSERYPVRLVTTPVHLRSLAYFDSTLTFYVAQIISATAPLTIDLARKAEGIFAANLFEIFGFSEAGSVATRATTTGSIWTLLDGFKFISNGDEPCLFSRHLDAPEFFPDDIRVLDTKNFEFIARPSDMINVGGKRLTISDLTSKLLAFSGVDDVYLYMQEERGRPAGFVTGSLNVSAITRKLEKQVDPVFIPRPLRKVKRILRNATGKVTKMQRESMLAESSKYKIAVSKSYSFPAGLSCFDGHFPGNPLVPGAQLLECVVKLINRETNFDLSSLRNVKFSSPVRPGEHVFLMVELNEKSLEMSFAMTKTNLQEVCVAKGKGRVKRR